MPSRALIIAIEHYSDAEDIARTLPGTVDTGNRFRHWLIHTKRLDPRDIWYCVDEDAPGRTADTTHAAIVEALRALAVAGQDKTPELYVLFAGHGFGFRTSPKEIPSDVLVAREFKNLEESGGACLKLNEIQAKLFHALGPGDHYYFIDACRTELDEESVEPTNIGVRLPPSALGRPTIYTLFSATRGATAATGSRFGNQLVSGLTGAGQAKVWVGDKMFVTFESLFRYLKLQLKNDPIDQAKQGDRFGEILEVRPIPRFTCEVQVDNASTSDGFTLSITDLRGRSIGTYQFSGPRYTFSNVPDEYALRLTHPSDWVYQVEPPPPKAADLYDHCVIKFSKSPKHAGKPPPGALAGGPLDPLAPVPLEVQGSPNTRVIVRNVQTGQTLGGEGRFVDKVPPGTYEVSLVEDGWTVVRTKEVVLEPGLKRATVDIGRLETSRVRSALVAALPGYARDPTWVEFSETVGPTADADVSLWLSLVGASRILGTTERAESPFLYFRKLAPLPLETFDDVEPGQTALYVLLGLERARTDPFVGLSHDTYPEWRKAAAARGLPGVFECRLKASPGPTLLSIKIGNDPTLTVATCCLENRTTLVVVTETEEGKVAINQYLLPIGALFRHLDPTVQTRLTSNPLRSVKFFAQVQRLYSQRRSLRPPESSALLSEWNDLLHGKWLDPLMAIIAGYELVGQRAFESAPTVVANLRQFFKGLPDTEVLAKLTGQGHSQPAAPPFLLDGLFAFEDYEERLPLPKQLLDYAGPWTTWRRAVREPRGKTPVKPPPPVPLLPESGVRTKRDRATIRYTEERYPIVT